MCYIGKQNTRRLILVPILQINLDNVLFPFRLSWIPTLMIKAKPRSEYSSCNVFVDYTVQKLPWNSSRQATSQHLGVGEGQWLYSYWSGIYIAGLFTRSRFTILTSPLVTFTETMWTVFAGLAILSCLRWAVMTVSQGKGQTGSSCEKMHISYSTSDLFLSILVVLACQSRLSVSGDFRLIYSLPFSFKFILFLCSLIANSLFCFQSCENCIVCWKPQEQFEDIFKGVRGVKCFFLCAIISGKKIHYAESRNVLN